MKVARNLFIRLAYTEEERRFLKSSAAKKGKYLNDYVLELIKKDLEEDEKTSKKEVLDYISYLE